MQMFYDSGNVHISTFHWKRFQSIFLFNFFFSPLLAIWSLTQHTSNLNQSQIGSISKYQNESDSCTHIFFKSQDPVRDKAVSLFFTEVVCLWRGDWVDEEVTYVLTSYSFISCPLWQRQDRNTASVHKCGHSVFMRRAGETGLCNERWEALRSTNAPQGGCL